MKEDVKSRVCASPPNMWLALAFVPRLQNWQHPHSDLVESKMKTKIS